MHATRPRPFFLLLFALFFVQVCATGCSSNSVAQGPSDALRKYAEALQDGRTDEAYRMLSSDAKRQMTLETFRRLVRDNPREVREIAQGLTQRAGSSTIMATVVAPNGEQVAMFYDGDRWRIDAAVVDLYGQTTPRQTLLGFVRAFDRKRYDILLRYVPDAEKASEADRAGKSAESSKAGEFELTAAKLREAWEGPQREEMLRIVQALKAVLPSAIIEETGDSASMSYGAGSTVAFVREHGVWKIRDF